MTPIAHAGARIVACLVLAGVLHARAAAQDLTGEDTIGADEQVARFQVCYDFGCKTSRTIYLFESDWRPVAAVLRASASSAEERAGIAVALGMMEALVGEVTPTGADLAGNAHEGGDARGQMDCIDESTNATTYLTLFRDQRLLRWHRVLDRVYRAPLILDEHWAAQIEESATGRRFAVDSWPRENGQPAVVQALADWLRGVAPPALDVRAGLSR